MRIYIASDHAGFTLKRKLMDDLNQMGHEVIDMGNTVFDENDDYPDFIIPLARKVSTDAGSLGVVIGKSGNGEAIAANKVKGIYAAICLNKEMAKLAREHNNANVLALGAGFIDEDAAKTVVETFVQTPFTGDERHVRRLTKITSFESDRV